MRTKRQIDRILRWHKHRPSVSVRNAIVAHFYYLIQGAAARLERRLPSSVELGDLATDGFLGLLDAIDNFEPGRSEFPTFAGRRISGAMLDGLRSRDLVSRTTRQRVRNLEMTTDRLRGKTGVKPTPQELADEMGVSVEQYTKTVSAACGTVTRSLSGGRIWGADHTDQICADQLSDSRQTDPARALDQKLLREKLIPGLSRSERLLVLLYYYEGMTMMQIGKALDITESRVSQMHTCILARLNAKFTHLRANAA